jgi:hypothetical protein
MLSCDAPGRLIVTMYLLQRLGKLGKEEERSVLEYNAPI